MKTLTMLALSAGAALAVATAAQASGGCGPAFHRGYNGACYPNHGPAFVAAGPWVVGTFYPGHGYWDGHRWWAHRDHWRGGWRYR